MKKTLSTYEIADYLIQDDNAAWSRAGAFALAEYFEELEEDTGEEMELDVVAIRCDFSEYESLSDWLSDYGGQSLTDDLMEGIDVMDDDSQDQLDEKIREYIRDNGWLIEFNGGIIVSLF